MTWEIKLLELSISLFSIIEILITGVVFAVIVGTIVAIIAGAVFRPIFEVITEGKRMIMNRS